MKEVGFDLLGLLKYYELDWRRFGNMLWFISMSQFGSFVGFFEHLLLNFISLTLSTISTFNGAHSTGNS